MATPDMNKTRDQSTMTDRLSRLETLGLNLKEILNLASSLLLPLMLGIFTVVITFQQQRSANEQRLEDRRLAQQQREQDLNISIIQRAEDRRLAEQQREQDLNISILQRTEDRQSAQEQREQDQRNWAIQREQDMNNSRQQRELDRQLADEKRQQDYELANATRTMGKEQRDHELDIEMQRHRDSLFVAYMNELGQLLDRHNGTVTSNPVIAALVRAKTLTLARQLDPPRNSHLIRFLYEVGQLTIGKNPLDLSNAELNGIDLSTKTRHANMRRLCLAGAFLNNASFAHQDLTQANFHNTQLNGAIFTDAILDYAQFTESELDRARFDYARMSDVNFHRSSLQNVVFTSANATRSDFSFCYMPEIDGTSFIGDNASFTYSNLEKSVLSSASLRYGNFLASIMDRCDFTNTDLFAANLMETSITSATLIKANMNKTQIYMANLSHTNMQDATVDYQDLNSKTLSIDHSILPNGTVNPENPLILNGYADCSIPANHLAFGWRDAGTNRISIRQYPNDSTNCYFAPYKASLTMIQIYQLVNIAEKYAVLVRQGRAVAYFSARFGTSTRVDITFTWYNGPTAETKTIDAVSSTTLMIPMPRSTSSISVAIVFADSRNYTERWCDDVSLIINVDRPSNASSPCKTFSKLC